MVGLYFQLCQGSWLSFKTLTAVAETPLSRQRRYMRHKEGEKKLSPLRRQSDRSVLVGNGLG